MAKKIVGKVGLIKNGVRKFQGKIIFKQKFSNLKYSIAKGTIQKINGKRSILGFCDSHRKLIFVSKDLKRRKIEIYIHEALHAIFPNISEKKIESSVKEMIVYLKKMGVCK